MDLAWVAVSNDIWQDTLVHCWCSTVFVIHNNPPGGDVLLGSSLTRTTPPSVENTKVSLFAWCLLWYSFVAMSSTNMLCVWHRMQPFRLLTCLVLPFDCHVGLPLSNTTDSTLLVCLVTDGFGLGCCFQWYMAGYPSSLLSCHRFVTRTNNPPGGTYRWRDYTPEPLQHWCNVLR